LGLSHRRRAVFPNRLGPRNRALVWLVVIMKPHKHAEVIKAWADGAEIEYRYEWNQEWLSCGGHPDWFDNAEYRIKPEPKPDFYKSYLVFTNRIYSEGDLLPLKGWTKPNLQLTFDGETGGLKSAEVLK
jgi:hypothetical protein